MEFLGILLKINVSLLFFYLVYRFALRKLTFYNFNRFYLMAAIVISAIIPFLKYSNAASNKIAAWQQTVGIQPQTMTQYIEPKNKIDFIGIAENLYWAGVLVMAGIFLVQLASLIALYSRSRKTNYDGYSIRTSKDSLQAFSFFRSIFVNPHEHSASDLDAILKHESVHVKQWHSIDIIAGEMKRIFCWFNPVAWLMLAAIRENLEFIADRKVLQNGANKKDYQYALLTAQQSAANNSLTNNFNFSHLKMRITMMNKTKSSDLHLLKYLLAVPVLGAMLLISNSKTSAINNVIAVTKMETLSQSENSATLKKGQQNKTPQNRKSQSEIHDYQNEGIKLYNNQSNQSTIIKTDFEIATSKEFTNRKLTVNLPETDKPIAHFEISKNEIEKNAIYETEVQIDHTGEMSPNGLPIRKVSASIKIKDDNKEIEKKVTIKPSYYHVFVDGIRQKDNATTKFTQSNVFIKYLNEEEAKAYVPELKDGEGVMLINSEK